MKQLGLLNRGLGQPRLLAFIWALAKCPGARGLNRLSSNLRRCFGHSVLVHISHSAMLNLHAQKAAAAAEHLHHGPLL